MLPAGHRSATRIADRRRAHRVASADSGAIGGACRDAISGADRSPKGQRGLRLLTADGPGLTAFLARPHARVVVDLGCGDARATARLAAHEPSALVIGIDANLDAADRVIRRTRRAHEKGGLANLALVPAAADRLPADLTGKVDELRIDLPWGSLLEGLLAAEPSLLAGIVRVLAPGGQVRIVLNARALPGHLSPDQTAVTLGRALESAGLSDVQAGATAIAPDTGWGKRLAGGRPLEVIVAEARRA